MDAEMAYHTHDQQQIDQFNHQRTESAVATSWSSLLEKLSGIIFGGSHPPLNLTAPEELRCRNSTLTSVNHCDSNVNCNPYL